MSTVARIFKSKIRSSFRNLHFGKAQFSCAGRRILSVLLVIVLLESVLPANMPVSAADEIDGGTCGDNAVWSLDSDGTLTVSGTGEITAKSSESAYPWYGYRDSVAAVVLEDGITNIPRRAFYKFTNLSTVTIPDSVTAIGNGAFAYTALTSVTVPGGVASLGSEAFADSSLVNATLKEGVETIGARAFNDCDQLEYVILPVSLTSIESAAFENTSGFLIYYAGTSEQWSAIEIDSVMNGVCNFNSTGPDEDDYESGNLTGEDEETRKQTARGTCGSLVWVLYSDGTMIISGEGSMREWGGYTLVSWYSYRKDITSVILEDGVTSISGWAFYQCSNLREVSIPDSVTSIGNQAFDSCTSLTEIAIPDSVTSIGYRTFRSCGLTGIVLPASVTELGSEAFMSCTELTTATLLAQITEIKYRTFRNCTSLSSLMLSKSVTEISSEVFYHCSSLTDIYYQGTEEEWNNVYIVYGTISTNYPQDVTVHYECEIGDTDMDAGNNTSGTCGDGLTWTLDEDGTLTISGSGDMTEWTEATAPTWYDWRESIVKVVIEDGVTSIGSFAFSNCPNLATVIVPSSVVRIGEGAFFNDIYECNCATNLYYAGSHSDWDSYVVTGTNAFYRELSTYAVIFHYGSNGPEAGMEHIISMIPKNTKTDVDLGNYADGKLVLSITFDEEIELGTGFVSLCDYETGEIYRVISAAGEAQQGNSIYISDDGMTLTVEFTNTLFSTYPYFSSVQPVIPHDTRLYVTVDEDTVILSESGDTFVIREMDTWSFTTEWGLDVDTDYLHFYNSDSDFGTPSGYPLSSVLANMVKSYVMDDDVYFAKLEENLYDSVWTGSCYGMCAVTALAYVGLLNLEAWDVGADASCRCGDVTSPGDSTGEYGTMDLINYYHMLQYALDEHYESLSWGITVGDTTYELFKYGNVDSREQIIGTILEMAQNLSETREPFLLKICMKKSSGEEVVHSVLVTGYRRDDEKNVLEVYDPSCINLYGEIVIVEDGLEFSSGPYSAFTEYTYDVSINSEEWGMDIPITSIGYTTVEQLNRYNIDDWVLSETSENTVNSSASGITGQNISAQNLSYAETLGTSDTETAGYADGSDAELEETTEASDAEEYATICFYGNGNYIITNAEGQIISREDGSFTCTMEIYDVRVLGEGSDFEYMILTDASSSFSVSSENDSICLSVFCDGIYMDAYADGNADMITITSDASVQIDGESAISYRTHYLIDENELPMTGILGTSNGAVTFACAENEQILVSSDELTDTLIRYYDLNGTESADVAVADTDGGILVDMSGGNVTVIGDEESETSAESEDNGIYGKILLLISENHGIAGVLLAGAAVLILAAVVLLAVRKICGKKRKKSG